MFRSCVYTPETECLTVRRGVLALSHLGVTAIENQETMPGGGVLAPKPSSHFARCYLNWGRGDYARGRDMH